MGRVAEAVTSRREAIGRAGCQDRWVGPPFAASARDRLRTLPADPGAQFRDGQLEAIRDVVVDRARVLCVQRTGWGKSAVYFVATAMLREAGAGATLIVRPLLGLMGKQVP